MIQLEGEVECSMNLFVDKFAFRTSLAPLSIFKTLFFDFETKIGASNFERFLHQTVAPEIVPLNFGDSPLNARDEAQTRCVLLKSDTWLNISWTFHVTS